MRLHPAKPPIPLVVLFHGIHEVGWLEVWPEFVHDHELTRNFCLMALRKKNLIIADGEIFADEDSSENHFMEFSTIEHLNDDFDIEQNLTKLEDCLKTLNSEQKQSVELFFMQEKTYQEVAQVTGFEINKVKSYLQNGKRNLKICMDK